MLIKASTSKLNFQTNGFRQEGTKAIFFFQFLLQFCLLCYKSIDMEIAKYPLSSAFCFFFELYVFLILAVLLKLVCYETTHQFVGLETISNFSAHNLLYMKEKIYKGWYKYHETGICSLQKIIVDITDLDWLKTNRCKHFYNMKKQNKTNSQ